MQAVRREVLGVDDTAPPAAAGVTLGIHAHNDSETGVANTLAAVRQGATQVQGTINGYGERCGNANLVSVIPDYTHDVELFPGMAKKWGLTFMINTEDTEKHRGE